jgi:hypothetical protein
MQPLRLRVDRIVDFGTVVSLVGVDCETTEAVTVHVDQRPFAVFWAALRKAGFPEPVEYAAEQLMLHLDMRPADGAIGARLVEANLRDAAVTDEPLSPHGELEQ